MNPIFLDAFYKTARLSRRDLERGYDRLSESGGRNPVFWLAEKVVGKKPVQSFGRALHRKAREVDTRFGAGAHTITRHLPKNWGRDLFVRKDKLPIGKGRYQDVRRTSILEPAVRASEIVVPTIAGVELEKQIRNFKQKRKQSSDQRTTDGSPTA